MSYQHATPPTWVVATNVILYMVYTCVVPVAFPEWGVPYRHGLSSMCLVTAFLSFKNRTDRMRMYAVAFCVTGVAFAVEMSCISDHLAESVWGRASGCEHHIPIKALVLGFHFSMSWLPLIYDVTRMRAAAATVQYRPL
jgi:hypothetical protein